MSIKAEHQHRGGIGGSADAVVAIKRFVTELFMFRDIENVSTQSFPLNSITVMPRIMTLIAFEWNLVLRKTKQDGFHIVAYFIIHMSVFIDHDLS